MVPPTPVSFGPAAPAPPTPVVPLQPIAISPPAGTVGLNIAPPAPVLAAADLPESTCRVMIVYGQQQRNGRRTQAQILKDQWEELGCYHGLNGDPLFEQFGMDEKEGRRYSRRLYMEQLLKRSKTG